MSVRFYLDENMPVAIAEQLRRRGIAVVTVRDLDLLGSSDMTHLERAARMGYVLCTHDPDFVDIAASGNQHAGIVFGKAHVHTIGDWVAFLELMDGVYDEETMKNLVEYVFKK